MSKVALMDCNNFFVSCERLFRPDLLGKPVAVLSGVDGCIVARSNEVKAMGVPMGMPLFQAKQLVDMDSVALFTSNFALYRDISARVMKVLSLEVGKCQVYSIDEAFFSLPDTVTESEVMEIRSRVMAQVGIPVAIGVSNTKTLAKIASAEGKKENGVCILTKDKWTALAKGYPTGSVWNLGRATTKRLSEQGVKTAAEFMALDAAVVQKIYGVGGRRVQDELFGHPVYKILSNSEDLQKSIMSSRSFSRPSSVLSELESALSYHVSHIAEKLREKKLLTSRLYVSLGAGRHSDFAHHSKSTEIILPSPSSETGVLLKHTLEAATKMFDDEIPYKKVGVVAGQLIPESFLQSDLFSVQKVEKDTIGSLQDMINQKFGKHTLRFATQTLSGPVINKSLCSPSYTTKWSDIPTVKTQ